MNNAHIKLRRRTRIQTGSPSVPALLVHLALTVQTLLAITLMSGTLAANDKRRGRSRELSIEDEISIIIVTVACIARVCRVMVFVSCDDPQIQCRRCAGWLSWFAIVVADLALLVLLIAQAPCDSNDPCLLGTVFTFTSMGFIGIALIAKLVFTSYKRCTLRDKYEHINHSDDEDTRGERAVIALNSDPIVRVVDSSDESPVR